MNWDPIYAFGQNLASTPPSGYQTSDPYSQIFYAHSNSYGSGYSDALMSQYAVGGPLISVSEPGTTTNVPNINLTIYADGETPNPITSQGYTVPQIYHYIASPGGYAAPNFTGTPNINLNFASSVANNAGVVLANTDTITLDILNSNTGGTGGGPSWDTITFAGGTLNGGGTLVPVDGLGLWQNWTIAGSPGSYTATPTGTGNQPAGTMLIDGFPVAQSGTAVSWYEIGVGGKTFNLYTTTINGQFEDPNYTGQQGALAIDGLATVTPPQPTAQTVTTFTVNFSTGDTVTFDPSLLVANTGNLVKPTPVAPVAGILSGGTFTALANQTNLVSNTITSTAANNIAFAWTGENSDPNTTSWITGYTNKIDAEDVARVTIISNGSTITTTGTADIDGQWQTGTVALNVGTYTVTMQEFLATDTSFANPLTLPSSALTLTENPPCFVAGTRIRTAAGEVPVERLAVGDMVLSHRGEAQPIAWIGKGKVLATPGRRTAATPVIVRKGALADNVPNCDLHITKGHSLYLDEVLIPVEFLVNHRSIVWDDRAQEVEFYHIELATHDVLLANGAPAESYRDDGNRWLFQNANAGWDLPEKPPCAPVLTGGPVVDAAWRRLLDRSNLRLDISTAPEPDLHLLVNGNRVDGRALGNGVHVFRLANPSSAVRVVSRAGAQDELGLARDPRLLGVALRRVMLWQGRHLKALDADDDLLTDGFHAFEADNGFRWTDGDARLPAALFDGVRGNCDLELHVGCTAHYELIEDRVREAA